MDANTFPNSVKNRMNNNIRILKDSRGIILNEARGIARPGHFMQDFYWQTVTVSFNHSNPVTNTYWIADTGDMLTK